MHDMQGEKLGKALINHNNNQLKLLQQDKHPVNVAKYSLPYNYRTYRLQKLLKFNTSLCLQTFRKRSFLQSNFFYLKHRNCSALKFLPYRGSMFSLRLNVKNTFINLPATYHSLLSVKTNFGKF